MLAGISILLFLGVTVYFFVLPRYTSTNLVFTTQEEKQDDLIIITDIYQNPEGKVIVAADKGYAVCRKTTKDGQIILEEYLNEAYRPIAISSGYSAIRREYEDGLNTKTIYLGTDGKPVTVTSGYDTIRRTYNTARQADTDTYWRQGEQVERIQGYWSLKRIYSGKRIIRQEYRDRHGNLTINSSGYAYWEREYNSEGQIAVQRYYDIHGEPAKTGIGYYGFRREYDEQGRIIQTTYLGADGKTANTDRGYAIVKKTYETTGSKTMYYDQEEKPVTAGKSQYGMLTVDGKNTYLDEDGGVMLRLDNILYSSPVAVLVFGVIATGAAFFVKGKWRLVFIVLYCLFILYMTMAWRETGTVSHSRLEPFWSYRVFFSNRSLRQEIINNVWLFVPFGTTVFSLLRERSNQAFLWTVLISILFSVLIESVQLIAGIGLCEIDDVISNGLGGMIGAVIVIGLHTKTPMRTAHYSRNRG